MISDNSDRTPKRQTFIPAKGASARLHLDGRDVGIIVVEGWDAAWTYGHFTPGEHFSDFATLFGRWSLLMHEDEDRPLHQYTHDALAEAERQMDALHGRIHYPEHDVWTEVRQLNIDGPVVEWQEF